MLVFEFHKMAQTKTLKVKKKRWVGIAAPALFDNMFLGEVYLGEAEEAIGRVITVSLMAITGDPKRQATKISFKIDGVQEGVLTTSIKGMEVLPSSVKRLVRRNKERVDDSFNVVTQDGKKIRIKPMIVTRNSTSRAVCSKLKARGRDFIISTLTRTPPVKFVMDINMYKFQKEMSSVLSKIYPVSICEVRHFSVIGTGVPPVLPSDEVVEAPKEPVEEAVEAPQADAEAEGPKKRSRSKKPSEEPAPVEGAGSVAPPSETEPVESA